MKHPVEDLLDDYALGRITDEVQLASVEEHLLICAECRRAVEAVDAIRLALARSLAAKN